MSAPRPVEVSHRVVLAIAAPMTLASLSTPLLGIAASAVVGQIPDPALLGAVALASVLFDLLFWGFGALRLGTAGLTAQALGAGDGVEERAGVLRALGIAALAGLALVLLQAPIAGIAFPLLGGSPAVTAAARAYFAVRIWSAPFTLGNYAVLGWLVGLARTGTGLAVQVGMNLANIALSVSLGLWLGGGVRGVAAAAVIAEALGLLAGLAVLARHYRGHLGVGRGVLLDRGRLRRMLGLNRDLMVRTLSLLVAFLFFARQGALAGDVTLAANGVLNNLFLLGGYVLDGLAVAAEQLCGRAMGARNGPAFRRAAGLAMGWTAVLATLVSLALYAGGGLAIRLMARSPAVQAAASSWLPYAALTPLVGCVAFTYDGIFSGATWNGAMRNLMLASLAGFLLAWWLLRPYGNDGLWLALLAFLALRGVGQALAYPGLVRGSFAPA